MKEKVKFIKLSSVSFNVQLQLKFNYLPAAKMVDGEFVCIDMKDEDHRLLVLEHRRREADGR